MENRVSATCHDKHLRNAVEVYTDFFSSLVPDILLQWKSHYQPLVCELVSANTKHFSPFFLSLFKIGFQTLVGCECQACCHYFLLQCCDSLSEKSFMLFYIPQEAITWLLQLTDSQEAFLSLEINSWSCTNEIRLCLCWCLPVKETWWWIVAVKSIFKGRGINIKLWLLASMSAHGDSATEKAIVLF